MRSYTVHQASLIERFEELRWTATEVDEFLEKHFHKTMDLLSRLNTDEAFMILKDEEPKPLEEMPERQFAMKEFLARLERRREENARLEGRL